MDEARRTAERAAAADADVENEARLLSQRMRSGELAYVDVETAAFLGHLPAGLAVGALPFMDPLALPGPLSSISAEVAAAWCCDVIQRACDALAGPADESKHARTFFGAEVERARELIGVLRSWATSPDAIRDLEEWDARARRRARGAPNHDDTRLRYRAMAHIASATAIAFDVPRCAQGVIEGPPGKVAMRSVGVAFEAIADADEATMTLRQLRNNTCPEYELARSRFVAREMAWASARLAEIILGGTPAART